ncbi:peptidoglycan-binding domain-containing protein [Streptomyces sp. NBC_01244]|uniref:peptidoglycan-binding domain-containing protein n=1 Tax=Streptomyces sp. NBC_01244 TaxID=2903797 RepID=UPI002E10774E|nr:peptidoglycan-binding protein [Streptomyces sp. NBC_01244]
MAPDDATDATRHPVDNQQPGLIPVPAVAQLDPPASGIIRRRKVLGSVVVAAALFSIAGVGVGSVIKSPAQAAADKAAPPPSVLSAVLEKRVLKDTVTIRGMVSADQSVQVNGAPAGLADGGKPVVTKVNVKPGETVAAGKVLVETSGRPVFALEGTLPVYRDLKPGATGQDVAQLQKALAALGHNSGADSRGMFGAGTKAAVQALYTAIGYDVVPASPQGKEQLEGAQTAVTQAERASISAKEAWEAAKKGAADRAAGSGGGTAEGFGTGSEAGKSPGPEAGSATGGGASGGGVDPVKEARRTMEYAAEDLAKARTKLIEVRAVAGPMVPAGEVVFLKGFPARVDAVTATVGATVGEKLLTVSAGDLVVKGTLAQHEKGLVRPGQKVQILSELSGVTATGTVSSVADTPALPQGQSGPQDGTQGGASSGSTQGYPMLVKPDGKLDVALAGQDVRVTVEAAASSGPVLSAPVSAISAGADNRMSVTVLADDGTRRRVEVTPGMSADGFVEITAAAGGQLTEGEKVLVGVGPALGTSAGSSR